MELGHSIDNEQVLSQKLNQSQIERLNILAMNNEELSEFVDNEQLINPMLEIMEGDSPTAVSIAIGQWLSYPGGREGFHNAEELGDGEYFEIANNEENSLFEYLKSQISLKLYSKEELEKIVRVLQHIDESTGYLVMKREELRRYLNYSQSEMDWIMSIIRKLEPVGIGSEDLTECLLWQLEAKGLLNDDLKSIVKMHLEDIASGSISTISRALHISTSQTREYIKIIRSLSPRPAKGFGGGRPKYVIPDVKLYKNGDMWEAEIYNYRNREVCLSDLYIKMAESAEDEELVQYFNTKINRAKFIIKCIKQRRETIHAVTLCIADKQQDFIEEKGSLKVLTLTEVAQQLDLHVSTVSRAIRNKYLETPSGVYSFRDFFTNSASKSSSEENNGKSRVKRKIVEIIETENSSRPYSDREIVELLQHSGLVTSRRTISKYREELGIGNAFERRQ